VVLVVCPNVTIRSRLAELDPKLGDASVYRKADLVPPHLMPDLSQGDVVVTNWHVFEPRTSQAGGIGGRVVKAGRRETKLEIIHIGMKTTTARGKRYLTKDEYVRQASLGLIEVIDEARDRDGNVTSARVTRDRYVESDTGHAKSDEAKPSGCGSRSTRSDGSTGLATRRAGRFIRKASRIWQRSVTRHSIRLVVTFAASCQSAC
jgi:hypothetical protein